MTPIRITEAEIDPAGFFKSYITNIAANRAKELEALGLDEVQSSRGWIGYELPGCSWRSNFKPTISVANWIAWASHFPGMVAKVVVDGNNTCIVKRSALKSLDEMTWNRLLKDIKRAKNDSLLDEGIYGEVQNEAEIDAWNAGIWKEFGEQVRRKFEGTFARWEGDLDANREFEEAMKDKEKVTELYYTIARNYGAQEWIESYDGSMSLNVTELINTLKSEDVIDFLWPESERQLKLDLESAAQRIVNYLVEGSDPEYNAAVDYSERRERNLLQLADELKASGGKGRVSWPKIPAALLKRIWLDYGKILTSAAATGMGGAFVRNVKGLDKIADIMMNNIARLDATTGMMGHTEHDVRDELDDMGIVFTDQEWEDWMTTYFTDERGNWTLSDYGLPKLLHIYNDIFNAPTPEAKLEAIDRALNVIHQRSDLAALFVEGGSRTLQEIYGQGGYEAAVREALKEDQGPHDYSCLMIPLPDSLAQRIINWGREQIGNDIIYVDEDGGMGRETEMHVTLKYGLTDPHPSEQLLKLFRQTDPFELSLAPVSLFKSDGYDVVKMDISASPQLIALNRDVCDMVPAPGDKFPTYHPHVTVAYVKAGTCDRLEGATPFDDPAKFGVTTLAKHGKFTANKVIFSSTLGTKRTFDIGHPSLDAKMAVESWTSEHISQLLLNSPSD